MRYLIVINVLSCFIMALDKYKAKRKLWRVSEKALFLLAILGGSLGIYLGMYLFHHKTKKMKFYLGIPAIIVFQIILFFVFNVELF